MAVCVCAGFSDSRYSAIFLSVCVYVCVCECCKFDLVIVVT